ncbi:MAG: Uma2 family endonuclease [Planctomycetales bacterium]
MSAQLELAKTVYPESDGRPMGETDLHRDWMIRLIDVLEYRYRGQRVYVSGNLLLYYEPGNPKRFVSPDAFVVKNCDPGDRRVFKVWEEGACPQVVFEVTSKKTRGEDLKTKYQIYQKLGVDEYFLYDPTGEYLNPPLRGYRLEAGAYRSLEPDADGVLACEQLNIRLRVDNGQLVLRDVQTGEELFTRYEAAEAAQAEAEAARAKAEAARIKAEAEHAAVVARNRVLEAQLQRLRANQAAQPDDCAD